MRLVFQPSSRTRRGAQDVGFHAFYAIRNDEIAGAVAALRELAMTAPPQTGALRVSPALGAANPEPYATKVRAFVKRYGGDARLVRLTMNAQNLEILAQIVWALRGVEKQGDAFVDMTIVGATDDLGDGHPHRRSGLRRHADHRHARGSAGRDHADHVRRSGRDEEARVPRRRWRRSTIR